MLGNRSTSRVDRSNDGSLRLLGRPREPRCERTLVQPERPCPVGPYEPLIRRPKRRLDAPADLRLVRLRRDEQCPEGGDLARGVDCVVVRPAAGTVVLRCTAQLSGHRSAYRPWIGSLSEGDTCFVNVRDALFRHDWRLRPAHRLEVRLVAETARGTCQPCRAPRGTLRGRNPVLHLDRTRGSLQTLSSSNSAGSSVHDVVAGSPSPIAGQLGLNPQPRILASGLVGSSTNRLARPRRLRARDERTLGTSRNGERECCNDGDDREWDLGGHEPLLLLCWWPVDHLSRG